MNHLYIHTGISSKKENIFAAVFNIALKDNLNCHDKMTSFQNLDGMADVLILQ
jgi:alpha-L-arabinofuranosidase